jgi:hypothetical protein
MVTPHSSASQSKPTRWWALLWELTRCAGQQLFGAARRQQPIGYWARDRYGRWELRVPARSLGEQPPTGWVQRQR